MEVNFRPWTWIGLATACGVPLVAAAHVWALGGRHAEAQAEADGAVTLTQSGGRWIWVVPEVVSTLRDLARRRRPDASQWRHLRAEAFYSRRDPAPFGRAVAAPLTRRRAALERRLAWLKRALDLLARPPAFAINAWALAARARRERVTRPLVGLPSGDRVLVLAPHPDDETIMCGATLAKSARRGDPVRVVAVTSGAATEVGRTRASRRDGTGVGRPLVVGSAASVADVREAELRRAAAELGVGDVVFFGLADDGVAAARERLVELLCVQLSDFAPSDVYVPFPYDVHPDHVSTSLALADALTRVHGPAGPVSSPAEPQVHCGFVQTPASPGWITRVVPAGRDWRAKRRAVRAYASRGDAIFAKPLQLAWFNPGVQGRRSEAFVDLDAARYSDLCGQLEREGLTTPSPRSPWHPLLTTYELERTRVARAHIAVALRAAARG